MKSTVENLESTKVKLTVEVAGDDFKPAMDKAYREIAKQVNIPGFRKGHAPARIIDNRVGRAYVVEQAVNDALPGYYMAAVEENDLQVMAQPKIEVTEVPLGEGEKDGKLVFHATVEIVPAFELPKFADIKLEVDSTEVKDEDVDAELTQLRERFGSLKNVKRKAKKGDFVSIDLRAVIGEEEIDSVAGISYQIGAGNMLDGLDKALVGMKTDEEKTFQTKLAGGEHAGEEADVTVKVNSVKERELPEVDEDFVQLASEFDTVDELMADLREQVAKQKVSDQALQARDRLLEHLREVVKFDLPNGVVEDNVERRVEEGATAKQRKEVEKQVREGLRDQLLLERLAQEFDVQVTQSELLEFVLQTARNFGLEPAQLLQGGDEQIQAMVGELARTKGLALALGEVTVVDGDGNAVDLSEFTRDPAAEEATNGAEEAAEADAETEEK